LKSWRAVAAFKIFLEGEFSSENLIFWIKGNRFRADLQSFTSGSDAEPYTLDRQLERALGLYGEFVAAGAPRELNLPGPIKFEIKKLLDEGVSYKSKYEGLGTRAQQLKLEEEKPPDLTGLYDSAQDCIFRLVEKDSFERFKKTKAYEQLEQEASGSSKDAPSEEASSPTAAHAPETTFTSTNDDEVAEGEGCAICGRPLGGSGQKACSTCQLRQSRIQKEQEDDMMEDVPMDLPPPILVVPPAEAVVKKDTRTKPAHPPKDDRIVFALKSDLESLRKEVEGLRVQVLALTASPSPVSLGSPKLKPAEVIRGSTGEAKFSMVATMKAAAEMRDRENKNPGGTGPRQPLGKDETACTSCQSNIKPGDNWCTECGTPRPKAKAPPGPPK